MWLLDTARANLEFFPRSYDIPGGYAILSHTWSAVEDGGEDSFQFVQELNKEANAEISSHKQLPTITLDALNEHFSLALAEERRARQKLEQQVTELINLINMSGLPQAPSSRQDAPLTVSLRTPAEPPAPLQSSQHTVPSSPPWFNPRDRLSPKVRAFLERAEKAGYRYAWVDTCCIDKTSSAELTEAINSMFEYYSCSAVCYVYLSGVSSEHFDPAHDGHLDFQGQLRQWCRWCRRGWTLQELIASPVILFFSEEWTVIGSKHELAEILEESTGVPATVLRFEKPITDMSVAARMSWASHRTTTRPEDRAYCLFGLFGINMPTLYGEGGDNAFYRLLEEIMKTTRDTTIFLVGDSLVYRSWNEILERYSELREGSYSCYLFPSSPLEYVKHLCNNLSFKINPLYDYHDRKNEDTLPTPSGLRYPTFNISPDGLILTGLVTVVPNTTQDPDALLVDISCTWHNDISGADTPCYLLLESQSQGLYAPPGRDRVVIFEEPLPTDLLWKRAEIRVQHRPSHHRRGFRYHSLFNLQTFCADGLSSPSAPFRLSFANLLSLHPLTHPGVVEGSSFGHGHISTALVFALAGGGDSFLCVFLSGCDARPAAEPAPTSHGNEATAAPWTHYATLRLLDESELRSAGSDAHSCETDHLDMDGVWPKTRLLQVEGKTVEATFAPSTLAPHDGHTLQVTFKVF